MPTATQFQLLVAITGSLTTACCAIAYFHRVRLERPPIGAFNGRDLCVLACFIITLPMLYLLVPAGVLTGFLVITFLSALMITLRPFASTRLLWVAIPVLLVANLLVTRSMNETGNGVQVYWLLTSSVVMIASIGISNLYVQGGLRLRHVAWFTLFLAVYDIFFTNVVALTPQLAASLQGRPLDPSIGFATGAYNANVGLGDMLVFCLYAVAAYKGFGRRGALVSVIVIVVFGAIGPSVAPLLAPGFFGRAVAAFVPVMTIFGPATFVSYLWLSRTATERSGAQWLAEQAVRLARPRRTRAVRARVGLALPSCGLAGLVFATIAWSGDTTTTNAASPPLSRETGAGRLISMRNVAFSPASATVKIGQTVTWTNADRAAHNVVATSGATFHSSRFGIGGTFRFRAERPGRITYVCTLHPGMNGTITITR